MSPYECAICDCSCTTDLRTLALGSGTAKSFQHLEREYVMEGLDGGANAGVMAGVVRPYLSKSRLASVHFV